MTTKERLHRLVEELPEELTARAEHMLRLLRSDEAEDGYVCPHCGEREHVLNAETIRALEESRAGIGVTTYRNADELFRDLGI